jgi:RNA polymerase sigma factor (TIGR02999 family)
MGDITSLLGRWRGGDPDALKELTPLVYRELRDLAQHYLTRERTDHTLQPTALVHEAYLRLTGVRSPNFSDRVHFYGAAANVMRRILVDHAREHRAAKRGSGQAIASLDDVPEAGIDLRFDVVCLNDALDRLAAITPEPARVVELRYFGGLSIAETAEYLDVSPATVKRHWTFARAWLHRALASTPSSGS